MDVKEQRRTEEWLLGCFIIASGLILFFNLWGRSLENYGYLRYAEVAREMIRSGEWVVPHLNGTIFIDKPPLLFWLIAVPSSLYGSVTPLIAHLPSAFSAWIGVIILFLWGKKVYGKISSGLIAGGILLSSYQYFFQARLAKTDILLCLFVILSLYFFYLGYHEIEKKRAFFHGLSFFFIGLGTLTKGPFGLFIPLLIILFFLIKEKEWKRMISREFILGYILLALVVLIWIFLFIHRVGWEESIELVKANKILTRRAPVYFYFLQIWVQFFPGSLLLPFLFFYVWRHRVEIWHSRESFFLVWFIVIFILLTLFKYRASRYLLPALPPFALMIGGMWKKKIFWLLLAMLFFITIWHSVEFYKVRKSQSYSPRKVLAGELQPFLRESALLGYRLDRSTIEEINFYLDPNVPIPNLRKGEHLPDFLHKRDKRFILMPQKVYEEFQIRESPWLIFVKEFQYKKEKLVLVSY